MARVIKIEGCVECGDFLNKTQDNMDERICMTCVLKKESPDVIRPSILTEERKMKVKKESEVG